MHSETAEILCNVKVHKNDNIIFATLKNLPSMLQLAAPVFEKIFHVTNGKRHGARAAKLYGGHRKVRKRNTTRTYFTFAQRPRLWQRAKPATASPTCCNH
jgi:hypothetical protein